MFGSASEWSNPAAVSDRALSEGARLLGRHHYATDSLAVRRHTFDDVILETDEHVVVLFRSPCAQRDIGATVQAVRQLGVRTPDCLAHGPGFSIWEKHRTPERDEFVPWRNLMADLAKLHAQPGPAASSGSALRPHLRILHRLAEHDGPAKSIARRVLDQPERLSRHCLTFGGVRLSDVALTEDGEYAGLIGWHRSDWGPPEIDYALLSPTTIRFALERAHEVVDWELVAAIRVAIFARRPERTPADARLFCEALGMYDLLA